MSTARKQPDMHHGPIYKEVSDIIVQMNQLILELSKNKDIPTLQSKIDQGAKDLMTIVSANHTTLFKTESYIKNAIIDLTEVPYMQPQMQRIAFEVAIRAAIKNLESFLASTPHI